MDAPAVHLVEVQFIVRTALPARKKDAVVA